mgnify:CR=1 FL=1
MLELGGKRDSLASAKPQQHKTTTNNNKQCETTSKYLAKMQYGILHHGHVVGRYGVKLQHAKAHDRPGDWCHRRLVKLQRI